MFTADWFWHLDETLREHGLDSDAMSFDEILARLSNHERLTGDEFAFECAYVILAGGFSQKTAKKIHKIICEKLKSGCSDVASLLQVFNNKNKINAIYKIWNNRDELCNLYYSQKTLDDKLNFIATLPHIGKITANHLARNLGENVVKYDVWIQRLGIVFARQKQNSSVSVLTVDNKKLSPQIKKCCDDMFDCLAQETNLPIGYIDVVLWKSAQNGLIAEVQHGCEN